jgi:predicted dehydrogenase
MDIEIMLEEARPRILRVGIIAFGASGRIFHAPFILPHPLFELAAVFERGDKTNGADFAAKHGYLTKVDTERSAEALCSRADIDLIVVCRYKMSFYN